MFDIGFPELLLVSVVALLVIGPEKLPETIRTMSLWIGRLKRSLAHIRQEIETEVGAEEIRRQLRSESVLQGLEDTKKQLDGMITEAKDDIEAVSRMPESRSPDSQSPEDTENTDAVASPADTQPRNDSLDDTRAGQRGE